MAHEAGVDRFLGWRQVRDLTGLGRTTAWRMRCAGDFPQPVPISPGRVAWRERDIVAWNESRGALIPVRPRPVAKPPNRAPETRTLPLVGAEPAVGTMSPDEPTSGSAARPDPEPAKPRPVRRPRQYVAEGQLGFDF